jgi:hypothetical protein
LGFSSARSSTMTVSLSFFANFAVFFSVITLGFRAELNFRADPCTRRWSTQCTSRSVRFQRVI